MEEQNQPTNPIAGEPALMKHIGYALELIGEVIDEYPHSIDIEDLIKIQHHLINAKHSVPRVSYHEGSPSIADELEAADLEGWN